MKTGTKTNVPMSQVARTIFPIPEECSRLWAGKFRQPNIKENKYMKITMNTIPVAVAAFGLACFAVLSTAQAVNPPPGDFYPGANTAAGQSALLSLATGHHNTAVGYVSLQSDVVASYNTGIGAGTLSANTADENTATGCAALFLNTVGTGNTANGGFSLFYNTIGSFNTAHGDRALFSNTAGEFNTAVGAFALYSNIGDIDSGLGTDNTANGYAALEHNINGLENTASGSQALLSNIGGSFNTANGFQALSSNTSGSHNTANGVGALASNTTGSNNTANGDSTLFHNTTGSNNTAIGKSAGAENLGSFNVCIGAGVTGFAGDNNTVRIADNLNGVSGSQCFIGGIVGGINFGSTVKINPITGQLGEQVSSARFKKDIDPMGKSSETIFSLKPVTFHYKNDTTNTPQFGLIAEEVGKVNPALIGVDKEGKPYSVQYDAVNAMLLNEFLKEHKRVEEQQAAITQLKSTVAKQEATVAQQQTGMEVLTAQLKEQAAQIQRVSIQLKVSKFATGRIRGGGPAQQVVNNR
jgi:uncharacterized coiled-coil protein SlyX